MHIFIYIEAIFSSPNINLTYIFTISLVFLGKNYASKNKQTKE